MSPPPPPVPSRERFILGGAPAQPPTLSAWTLLEAEKIDLGLPNLTIHILEDFIIEGDSQDLSAQDRAHVLAQAAALIQNLYPHLPFKQQLFNVDPAAAVAALNKQIGVAIGADFHIQMHKLFAGVRDPHTAWQSPAFYQGAIAFLPFRIGMFVDESSVNRYIVTDVMSHLSDIPEEFEPGVELVSSDEMMMDSAAADAALLSPGSNPESQLLRGIQRMTLQPLGSTTNPQWRVPFKGQFREFSYIPLRGKATGTVTFRWAVATGLGAGVAFAPGVSMSRDLREAHSAAGILFNRRSARTIASVYAPPVDAPPADFSVISRFPDVFEFQSSGGAATFAPIDPADLVSSRPDQKFGYIAVHVFLNNSLQGVKDLTGEFARILRIMNQRAPSGLILDIRGNPGGDIPSAECMLEMLTPNRIEPARFHLANTPAVAAILQKTDVVRSPRIMQALAHDFRQDLRNDDPRLTTGQPLTTPADGLNANGQIYQGPVILLIDAMTYSAADIFAGGFQDNRIGLIIGQDSQTGGGGASVWFLSDLATMLPDVGLGIQPQLPLGCSLSLAFLRSTRVGANLGKPIEDVGVKADIFQPRTYDDLCHASTDVIRAACNALSVQPVYRAIVDVNQGVQKDGVHITVTATGVDTLSFLLDGNSVPFIASVTPGAPVSIVVPYVNGLSRSNPPGKLVVHARSSVSDDPAALRAVTTRFLEGQPDGDDGTAPQENVGASPDRR